MPLRTQARKADGLVGSLRRPPRAGVREEDCTSPGAQRCDPPRPAASRIVFLAATLAAATLPLAIVLLCLLGEG